MKVSIVIPMYNASKHIEDMLESIVNQKHKNIEIIIINDGSTDDSEIKARKYLENKNIEFKIIDKENEGQSKARNIGIKESKGAYIALLDADDYLHKEYVSDMLMESIEKEADVAICDVNYVKQKKIKNQSNYNLGTETMKGKEMFDRFIMHETSISPCSMLINKKYLDKQELLFNEESRYSEEYIFITKLMFNASKVVHIKRKLYNYCVRKGE